jgi:hypothetical protein
MKPVAWHWELTPREALGGYIIRVPPQRPLLRETKPFALPYESVEGTGLRLQWGVSSRSLCLDVKAIREFAPQLPDSAADGDRRSGILFFDGDTLVGYYVILGFSLSSDHRVWIHEDYRGSDLGQRVLLEWQKRVPRCQTKDPQKLNPGGAKTFLRVRSKLYRWAIDQGYDVPDKVRRELDTGAEAAAIDAKIALVLETRKPQTI